MKAGFTNSDGWIETAPIWSQRLAPLISGPSTRMSAIKRDADQEDDEARAPDLLRRQGRGREHDGDRGQQQCRVAAHEVERLEIIFGGDRRACRERQHEPRAHQQQQAEEHQPVDGEPPVGQNAAVGAGEPHAACPCSHALRRRRAP